MTADEILVAASEKRTLVERAAYLDGACGVDGELRALVEKLLRSHEEAGSFLEQPLFGPAQTIDQPRQAETPGTVIGPYKLLQQIGEGGMGTVFIAEQTEPVKRKVALKVIKAGMDSRQVVARFEAERQALAMMDHVNIARVFDGGTTENGRPYFVMELVYGVPITKYCDDNHLTTRQRLELFVPVCQAIQHAHQKGIIHRDIKPSNVIVTLYDGKPVPKVIDFGVAKATEQKLTERTLFTQYGTIVGTLEYMSPEQAEMSALGVDTRSDIYSLGVLLYELLTGSTPLTHKRMKEVAYGEILRMIKDQEPPKPSTRLSDSGEALALISAQRKTEPARLSKLMRGELDWIVMKTLEKDRNRRYETANGFAADVQRYLADEPVLACPPSAGYRLRKFARRNRRTLATAGVIVLALVFGTAVSVWQAIRATHAEELARKRLDTATASEVAARDSATDAENQRRFAVAQENIAKTERSAAVVQEKLAKQEELTARQRFYAAQMNLAQQAWNAENPARVLELLEGQRPRFDQEDLRSFEWYHLWRRCNTGRRLDLFVPQTKAWCVAYSPDGKTLASGYWNSGLKLWDVPSGRERATLKGHHHVVGSLAFSSDGKTLVSGSFGYDANLKVWDAVTGKELASLKPDQGQIRSVAFAPDGKTLASGGEDATVKLWDVATWRERATLQGHTGWVTSMAFSPDSKTLASEAGSAVRLWDVTANPVQFRLQVPGANAVAFAPDGKTFATGSADGTPLRLWDVATGRETMARKTRSWTVTCVAFSPDGKTLAIGSEDRSVHLWEPATGRERSFANHDRVRAVAFAPDGQSVASACEDGTVKVWDVAPAQESVILQPKGGVFAALAFSPDGKTLASGGGDSTKLWNVDTGAEAAVIKLGNATTEALAFSHDGKTLAVSTGDTVKLIDAATHKVWGVLQAPNPPVRSMAFSPDDKMLATGRSSDGVFGEDNSVKLWNLTTRQVQMTMEGQWVAFSPDGKTLATGGAQGNGHGNRNGTVMLWDAATGQNRLTCKTGRDNAWGSSSSVAFSPDGILAAQATDYGTILVWDTARGVLRASLKGQTAAIRSIAFHPDGKTLASASADGAVKLWDAPTGQERITLTNRANAVLAVAFSSDGNTLATGSADGTVELWHAATDPEAVVRNTELEPDDPDAAPAFINEGDNLRAGGRPQEAKEAYRKALLRLEKLAAYFPKESMYGQYLAATHLQLAVLYHAEGKYDQAEPLYCVAVEEARKSFGRAHPQTMSYTRALADCYEKMGHHVKAEAILREGCEQAEADLSKAIERDAGNAALRRDRARIRCQWQCWDKALLDFAKALELSPGDWGIWDHRGMVYLGLNQPVKALADFTDSIAIDPKIWWVRQHRSMAYRVLGRWQEAIADQSKTVELAPQDFAAANNLAWLLATCPDPKLLDPVKAVAMAKKAVELAHDGNSWNTLGVAYYRVGDWKAAIEALNKSMGLRQGGDALDWFFQSMADWQQGDKEEARKWYNRAVEWTEKNDPKNEELSRFRSEAEKLLGVKEER